MRTLILVALVALCSGCTHRLPNIKAEAINQTVAFPGFTSTVDASGISITDATIRAADVSWRVSAMGFNSVTTAKGYQQKREKEMPDR